MQPALALLNTENLCLLSIFDFIGTLPALTAGLAVSTAAQPSNAAPHQQ